ncbi:glycoside hydrolase family 88 protein [Paenibacillus sp. strain BS8-2]
MSAGNYEQMMDFIVDKVAGNAKRFEQRLPTATVGGRYQFAQDGFWTGGFWTGMLMLCYEKTNEESYLHHARISARTLKKRLYEQADTLDHDIGFLYQLSYVADYKLTGDESARRIGLDAADQLLSRYHANGKFIQAWNVWVPGDPFSEENKGRIIIDCMYNLPILLWAHQETGKMEYYEAAIAHADTCAETIVRPDATTFHSYVFDPVTGDKVGGRTVQGYADDSCWSRGQTWAVGGYAYLYSYTKDEKYLKLAQRLADRYLVLTGDQDVPPWDFSVPNPEQEPLDSSAAAVFAASLLELVRHVDEEAGRRYRERAERIVHTLFEHYSTKDHPEHEGLLVHACQHRTQGEYIDSSLIYGDYYFAEAVAVLSGATTKYW